MTEYLGHAWQGWLGYTDHGKLAALLLAALLFLWLGRKSLQGQRRELLVYSTVMTVCCICPVTAAGLMLYQTRFYDYQWVWSLVPGTIVIAWGMTLFLSRQWQEFRLTEWKKGLPVTCLLLAITLLCGSMGGEVAGTDPEKQDRQQAAEVLAQVTGQFPEGEICLWAPRKVMEYTRETDPGIRLFYGRNLWDQSLNAYAYDVYQKDMEAIYVWMERAVWGVVNMEATPGDGAGEPGYGAGKDAAGESGYGIGKEGTGETGDEAGKREDGKEKEEADQDEITGEACVLAAREAGVNCILLPQAASSEVAHRLSELFGGSITQVEGYYLLTR